MPQGQRQMVSPRQELVLEGSLPPHTQVSGQEVVFEDVSWRCALGQGCVARSGCSWKVSVHFPGMEALVRVYLSASEGTQVTARCLLDSLSREESSQRGPGLDENLAGWRAVIWAQVGAGPRLGKHSEPPGQCRCGG